MLKNITSEQKFDLSHNSKAGKHFWTCSKINSSPYFIFFFKIREEIFSFFLILASAVYPLRALTKHLS